MQRGCRMFKVYGRNSSINVQKAVWAMGEAGLEWEWLDKDGVFGIVDVPDYASINPQLRIPTLDDNGLLVRQSNVIVRYVARKYAPDLLLPKDEETRVEAERWMDWQASDNSTPMIKVFWGLVRTLPENRDMAEIRLALDLLHSQFAILDAHLADHCYVAGDTFSMGDIPPGAAAYRYLSMDIDRPIYPHLDLWYHRLRERENYRNLVMVPLA